MPSNADKLQDLYRRNKNCKIDKSAEEADIIIPKIPTAIKQYKDFLKAVKESPFDTSAPLAAYQLLYVLALDIVHDCDGLKHLEEYDYTGEATNKMVYLYNALEMLTDSPCQSAITHILSTKERDKYLKMVADIQATLDEKGI